jgi:carbonic anhydrase/acetyltransferase-like protein (isoleucine patch superfamily)
LLDRWQVFFCKKTIYFSNYFLYLFANKLPTTYGFVIHILLSYSYFFSSFREVFMLPVLRTYKDTYPAIGNAVYLDPFSSIIGAVELADDVSIWPMCVLRGDVNAIKVGKRTNIQDGSVLHVARKGEASVDGYSLIIGEDVTVGHKAMLHACQIGNRVLIGMGAIVLDNARIDDDVILAAGALVPPNKHLQSGHLYVGSPACAARKLTEDEFTFLKRSAAHYVKLKDEYIAQG